LSAVPVAGGIARLHGFSAGAKITANDLRFLAAPVPIIAHVLAATSYCLLGAFQFSAPIRQRWPRGHRQTGKLLALCGLLVGLTGLWMTIAYAIPPTQQGPLLYAARCCVSSAMIGSILLAWRRILQRNVASHEAWMIRAYALGQGAGTQVVVLLPWMLISGQSGGTMRDVLMTLSWMINVAVAESIIWWRSRRLHLEIAAATRRRHGRGGLESTRS
ncbi:MAG TPA: DUF2306 domain-containing protein, partial [Polyangiaceae bacterium]|nr:DUF2306 domain-containing protein [Polyangiaceae bacterium]